MPGTLGRAGSRVVLHVEGVSQTEVGMWIGRHNLVVQVAVAHHFKRVNANLRVAQVKMYLASKNVKQK